MIYGLCGRNAASEKEEVLSRWLRCVPQGCDVFRFARVSQQPREQCLLTCRVLRFRFARVSQQPLEQCLLTCRVLRFRFARVSQQPREQCLLTCRVLRFRFARVSQQPREQCLLTCRVLRHPSSSGGGHPAFSCAPMLQFLARDPLIHFQLDRNPSIEDLLETDHTRSLLPNKPPDQPLEAELYECRKTNKAELQGPSLQHCLLFVA